MVCCIFDKEQFGPSHNFDLVSDSCEKISQNSDLISQLTLSICLYFCHSTFHLFFHFLAERSFHVVRQRNRHKHSISKVCVNESVPE